MTRDGVHGALWPSSREGMHTTSIVSAGAH